MKRWRIICFVLSLWFLGTQTLFDAKCVNAMQGESTNIKETEHESLSNYYSENCPAKNAVLALEIMNDDFHADKALSRAQAAEAAIKFLKLDKRIAPYKHLFFDVDETHWASGYIELCAAEGFVHGMGDGTFKPDVNISYQQLVKIIVCMTGWDSFALEHGGWADGGYIYAAKEAGIIQDDVGNINRSITQGEAAELLYRALEVNIRDETDSQQVINENIRDLVWDMEKIKGIAEQVDDNSAVVLVTDNSESTPLYEIGKRYVFSIRNTNDVPLVGDKILAYASEDSELIVLTHTAFAEM